MKITICRSGKFPTCNVHSRGCFVKEFSSIEEYAKFYIDHYPVFFYPNIMEELSKKERNILLNKVSSMLRKSRDMVKR